MKMDQVNQMLREAKFRNNMKKITSLMVHIKETAMPCVGGKKVFIDNKRWREFERTFTEIHDDGKNKDKTRKSS